MSKNDYICKNCPHNNYGWCKERKIQGLKSITECDIHDKYIMPDVEEEHMEEPKVDEFYERTMGELTMLWKLHLQFVAILENKDLSSTDPILIDLLQAINNISKVTYDAAKVTNVVNIAINADMLDSDIVRSIENMNEFISSKLKTK